jgi:sec-independent protein translocase protein TatA
MMIPMLALLSDWHIIVLFLLVVLLFGGKKLSEVARGLGEAIKEFRKASRDLHDEPQQTADKPAQPTASAPQHPPEPKQG